MTFQPPPRRDVARFSMTQQGLATSRAASGIIATPDENGRWVRYEDIRGLLDIDILLALAVSANQVLQADIEMLRAALAVERSRISGGPSLT
jgi:hypothetical protein